MSVVLDKETVDHVLNVLDKEDVDPDKDTVEDNNYKYCDPARLDGMTMGCGERIRIRPLAKNAEEALEEKALDKNGFHYCTLTVSFVYTDKKKYITTQGSKIPIILPAERKPTPCIYCERCDMIHSALALCIEDTLFI